MKKTDRIFHLAIPCHNLDMAEEFYTQILGCRRARRYDDRITLDFFGDQVVCHLAPDSIESNPQMYPRHFGITFLNKSEFDALVRLVKKGAVRILQEVELRFEGMREEHFTFAFLDPSNNVLEFKHYRDSQMIY